MQGHHSSKNNKKSMNPIHPLKPKKLITGVLATSMVVSLFAGSVYAAPATPASATSKILADLNFTNSPATPASITSDAITSLDFASTIYLSSDFEIQDRYGLTSYVTLDGNYPDMTALVADFNSQLTGSDVAAVVADSTHFKLQSKTTGVGSLFTSGSYSAEGRQVFTEGQVVQDGTDGTNKSKTFTIGDGQDTVSITLNSSLQDMSDLVSHLNAAMSSNLVDVTAQVKDSDEFTLVSQATGHSATITIGGSDASTFFAQASYIGQDSTQTAVNTTVSIQPTSYYGETVYTTLNVTSNDQAVTAAVTGTATLTVDGGTPQTVPLLNGSADFATTGLEIGDHTFEFTYNGDSTYNVGTVTKTLTTIQDRTVTQLNVTPSIANEGDAVTIKAVVPTIAPGDGNTTGTVSFFDGDALLTTGALQYSDMGNFATIVVSTLTAGDHSIRAVYNGDNNHQSSNSVTKTVTINHVKTDAEIVADAKAVLAPGYAQGDSELGVTQDLDLPLLFDRDGKTITASWVSSDPSVISNDGAVFRPTYAQGDTQVTMTATLSLNGVTDTRDFPMLVLKQGMTDADAVTMDKTALAIGYNGNDTVNSVTQDVILPTTGGNGTTITWQSSDTQVVALDGTVTRPEQDTPVMLMAVISKNGVSDTRQFVVSVLGQNQSQTAPTVVGFQLSKTSETVHVGDTITLPVVTELLSDGSTGSVITGPWMYDNVYFTANSGILTASQEGTIVWMKQLDYYEPQTYTLTILPASVVTPEVTVASLGVNPASVSLTAGQTTSIPVVTATYSDQTTAVIAPADITWTFQTEGAASLIDTTITGVAQGSTVLTATYGGQHVDISVTVTAPASTSNSKGSKGSSSSGGGSSTVAASEPKPATTTPETPAQPRTDVFRSEVVKTDINVVDGVKSQVEKAKDQAPANSPADMKGHWAEKTVDTFVKLGVIKGYEDGTAKPNQEITRAEFVSILSRIFHVQGENDVTLNDVQGHWAQEAIDKFVAAGVLNGYGDGSFKPDSKITREEMVIILSRIVNFDAVSKDVTKGGFSDLNGSFAPDAIQIAAEAGIISGQGDGKFDPKANSTRAEALQVILNALNLNTEIKTLLDTL